MSAQQRRGIGRWRLFRPRSVTGLLLTSFTLVVLPLLAATLYSVFYVDRLSDQSEQLVLRGVQAARSSKKLDTILTDMERAARQYKILDNPVLVKRFVDYKARFDATLQALDNLNLESMPSWPLDSLRQQAQQLAAAMHKGGEAVAGALQLFDIMREEVALIAQQGNTFIDASLLRLQKTAGNARQFLLLCLFTLVPGVILLAVMSTVVIARPVRQITRAINRLGKGDLNEPIHVSAPTSELDTLGRQLDWMRHQLATLEDQRNQFLRHMSHELKTPLASVREGAELLHDGTMGKLAPTQAEVVEIIRRNSIDLMLLIENLLDFAALQHQRAILEYSTCDLKAMAETVVQRQILSITNKHLTVLLPDQPIELRADKDRIHLIIDNLLSNAVKFSPHSGTIRIDASRSAKGAVLSVNDSGPGIEPNERELIFEAFYRGTNAHDDARIRGTGIGLSVVNECVDAHGGAIDICDSPDGGACFRITLPDGGPA